MSHLRVTYRITSHAGDIEAIAESLLIEQSVETPREVAERVPFVRDKMLGTVESIEQTDPEEFRVELTLPDVNALLGPAHLLNVLFGNASLHPHVVLEDFDLPPSVLGTYPGPRFGISGLREVLGAPGRPLTCTALKPVGMTVVEMSDLCRAFAKGGMDVIKDDHYLSDQPFCRFEDRVRACVQAVEEENARTGGRSLYAPHLCGTPDEILRHVEIARCADVRAFLVSPMLIGAPVFVDLVRRHIDVPVLAHPSFGGATRFAEPALLGKLFRLFGSDAVIFANFGGRFSSPPHLCKALADNLRREWGLINSSMPVPAGGMTVDRVGELVSFFGPDVMLLIGGSLLQDANQIVERTRSFVEAVRESVPAFTPAWSK